MAPKMVIVFPLTTMVTISSFPTPLPTTLVSFIPSYDARPDGSLITSQYMREIKDTKIWLFIVGFLLMLFTRNAIVSIDYLYRCRSKDKTLFYLLVASQTLGPMCFISLAVSYLSVKANCTVVYNIALVSIVLSDAFLITGILGIKAYRCLDRSRIVLSVISLLQAASTVLLCFDVSRLRSGRMASGTCEVTGDFGFFPISILLLFIQAFFICLCFVYTVWKASAYSAAQGRLSLAVSLETSGDECDRPIPPAAVDLPESRGWWDYVPEPRNDAAGGQRNGINNHSVFGHVSRLFVLAGEPLSPVPQRKSSIRTDKPLPHPRGSLFQLSEKPQPSLPAVGSQSPPQQRRGGFGRISRMRFVRAAMRDELFHAAAVALNCVVTLIFIVVGYVKLDFLGSPIVWLGVNWMLTSVIVMHSFSRVVKRHEKEAILQEPNTWDSMARHTTRREARRPTSSPISVTSHRRSRRHVEIESLSPSRSWNNPFRSSEDVDDPRATRAPEHESVEVFHSEPSSPPTPGSNFLPNHYPERIIPQPLESPTLSHVSPV